MRSAVDTQVNPKNTFNVSLVSAVWIKGLHFRAGPSPLSGVPFY